MDILSNNGLRLIEQYAVADSSHITREHMIYRRKFEIAQMLSEVASKKIESVRSQ